MQPIVIEQIVWSVSRSVWQTSQPCKNGWTNRDSVWVEDSGGLREPCVRWEPDPPWEVAFLRGKRDVIVKYRDTAVTVQKRLNRTICCLNCGLGWDEGNTCSFVFGRWCQCAQVQSHSPGGANELSVCGGDAAFMLNYFDQLFFKVLVHFACLQKIKWNVNIYIYIYI